MYKFGVILALLVVGSNADHCYLDAQKACSVNPSKTVDDLALTCNAKYGFVEELKVFLQEYANFHIETSFEYLLYSTHFGNYEVNRPGLKALYRHLSDKAWNAGINIMKFLATRGQPMNFNQHLAVERKSKVFEVSEFFSLARALDTEKRLAIEAFKIHKEAVAISHHDPSVAHYIEEEFLEKQAETVRLMSGYANDMKKILADGNVTLPITLFDDYILSQFK